MQQQITWHTYQSSVCTQLECPCEVFASVSALHTNHASSNNGFLEWECEVVIFQSRLLTAVAQDSDTWRANMLPGRYFTKGFQSACLNRALCCNLPDNKILWWSAYMQLLQEGIYISHRMILSSSNETFATPLCCDQVTVWRCGIKTTLIFYNLFVYLTPLCFCFLLGER